ncbi:MAG: glycosyltransferase family 39 protein [Symplocastrum torsivum CPER-KK1]|uniref:Glycosyltransferase family 39 protein n=1 Tax=Symplocastrum torsivum CPER-KK1 TaxID=450513 RepID=A0A951PNQ0_9CYAN|nr:glycosyltransferase family 39 protein [Symplocastrum torsivum CPER-KK1]
MRFSLSGIRFLAIVALLLGIFFRFINLDQKVYWGDEAYSSLRIAGYTTEEVVEATYTGEEIGIEELQKYQRPNTERGLVDTLKVLASEDSIHPPLYYIKARFWEQLFGSSVAVKRRLPALISLFAFPCLYWLCLELFNSSLTAWIAVALVAVSPIHLLYAQEVREYSLWTVSVLLASASLLYALRVQTKRSWIIYALTLALSLYSHLFSGMVAIAQGIYVLIRERFQWSQRLKSYILAATSGLLLFSPWLFIFLNNKRQAYEQWEWTTESLSPLSFYQSWVANLIHAFLDVQVASQDPFSLVFSYDSPITYLMLLIFLLVAYAIYFLFRQAPKSVWLFVLILMAATTLPLVLLDLKSGGQRSTIARYHLPSYLGIQLAVAYLLSTKLSNIAPSRWQFMFWRLITIILISCGIISCSLVAQSDTWWTKYSDYYNVRVAKIINQSPAPLLWSDSNYNRILSMSYALDSKVRLQLVNSPEETTEFSQSKSYLQLLQTLPNPFFKNKKEVQDLSQKKLLETSKNFSDVFLLEITPPTSLLRSELQKSKNYKFELAYEEKISFKDRKTLLWRLAK